MDERDQAPRDSGKGPTILLMVLGLAFALGACTEGREVARTEAVPQGEPLAVEDQPFLTLGVAEGNPDQEFYRVRRPFLLPGGQVVVPLAGDGEIRVFSPDGDLEATYGRSGEGPGEFRSLSSAWARGDTIEAFDSRLSRVTRFLPDGTTETVDLDHSQAGYSLDSAIPGAFRDGWAVIGMTGFGSDRRDQIAVSRFSRDGGFVEVIARTEGILRDEAGRGPEPLSPSVSFAVTGDGLFVGETLTPAIQVLDPMGTVEREIAWVPHPPEPGDALREVVRLALERAEPEEVEWVRESLGAAPVPEAVPLFSAFMVDELGFLWLRPYEVSRDAAALGGPLYGASPAGGLWWIFTPDGERLGSVETPADLKPYHITADAIVGIRQDELGLEYVQLHRLERR